MIDSAMAADALNRVAEAGGFDDILEMKDEAERHVWLTARVADFIDNPEAVSWVVDEERVDVPTGPISATIVDTAGNVITKWKKSKGTISVLVKRFVLFYARKASARG